jgi:hypothetical protein
VCLGDLGIALFWDEYLSRYSASVAFGCSFIPCLYFFHSGCSFGWLLVLICSEKKVFLVGLFGEKKLLLTGG